MSDVAVQIQKIDPASPEVRSLIGELDHYQSSLYPSASNHLDDLSELSKANVYFIGAKKDGALVGIGAVKKFADYGELKRMFVTSACRGHKVADLLLVELERHLVTSGIYVARLETGIHQTAAIKFYERLHFERRPPFGTYKEDVLSIFMEKRLTPC